MIDLKPELADENVVLVGEAAGCSHKYVCNHQLEGCVFKYNYVVHWYNSDEDAAPA